MKIAIYAITVNGAKQAQRLQRELPFADVFVTEVGQEHCHSAALLNLPLVTFVADKFTQYDCHVCIFAAGIVTRTIAPLLNDKRCDPAVICVDDQGQFAIPLLSGHRGGANAQAQRIAQILKAQSVVTTASDAANTLSVDMLGAPFGWSLDSACEQAITAVSAAVVNEQSVVVVQQAGERNWWPYKRTMPKSIWCHHQLPDLDIDQWQGLVLITDQAEPDGYAAWQHKAVLWRPKSLVLGIGCDRNTPQAVIQAGISAFLAENNLAADSVAAMASIDLKADECGLIAYSLQHQLPFITYSADQLRVVTGIENPSAYVEKITGVSSVAEAAALKQSGTDKLIAPKWKFKQAGFNMTLACCRINNEEGLAKHSWKNWLADSIAGSIQINAHGSEVVKGYQCKPRHVDLNRPMLHYRHHILLCEGARCSKEGSKNLTHDLRTVLKEMGLASGDERIKISRTMCAGACRNRATMVIYERLDVNELPVNNAIWLRHIEDLSRTQWHMLFNALALRQPLRSVLPSAYFADIDGQQGDSTDKKHDELKGIQQS
ncbi:cobalamin biosynthesis protein [Photobacterium nomapromontoriensis]|uniref:cobalamin biosynthesis protein n=1 Tax=Photobacterium nomapromontoriensis TaxID=2910237 RepID=UPI003D0E0DFD